MAFLGEINLYVGNRPPQGWLFCEGQKMEISKNKKLFALIGTTYGGDGENNFHLPDLRGRTAIQAGSAPGLTERKLGEKVGTAETVLTLSQMGNHTHAVQGKIQLNIKAKEEADKDTPIGNYIASKSDIWSLGEESEYQSDTMANQQLSYETDPTGGNKPINNAQPSLGLKYMIYIRE